MRSGKRWYRKFVFDRPAEEVERIIAESTDPESYSHTPLAGPYTPADTADLVGRTLEFKGEERCFAFRFTALNELWFKEADAEEKRCFCNVKTLDQEIYFANFLVPGYVRSRQVTLVADLKTGCATVCDATIGTPNSNIDVDHEFFFGRLEGEFEGGELHGFTSELVGKAITWTYSPKIISIKHIYNSNLYYTYMAKTDAMGVWMACNPADYVKIRDNIFLFSFIEERQVGLQSLFLIDLNRMHDIGCFYGAGSGHLTSACLGAIGEMSDPMTVC